MSSKQKYPIIAIKIQNFSYFLNESRSRSHLLMHFCSPPFRLSKAPKRSAIPASGKSEKHVALQSVWTVTRYGRFQGSWFLWLSRIIHLLPSICTSPWRAVAAAPATASLGTGSHSRPGIRIVPVYIRRVKAVWRRSGIGSQNQMSLTTLTSIRNIGLLLTMNLKAFTTYFRKFCSR
jgi:hypothetical protein